MSFKVKALYNYSSEHDDDLKFGEGQIITITDEEDADWYTGEYTDDATGEHRSGLFPRNFVEPYEPVTPPRPTKRPQAAAPVPVSAPPPAAEAESDEELEPEEDLGHASGNAEIEEEAEEEEEERHEAAPVNDTAPPPLPVMATKPVSAPSQESRQPPVQATKPVPPPPFQETVRSPPIKAAQPPEPESDSKPVVSSFKDRIAAFNRGGAAPVAPPKPGGLGGGSGSSGFVKKAYVAPPPSRNAYIPPPTQAPVAKIYRREEDPDLKPEDRAPPPPPPERSEDAEEDQPKPMSLKERMAMLQKQQLEQQAKHADAAAKKAKPKPPPKKPSGTSQPSVPEAVTEESAPIEPPTRVLSNDSIRPEPLASPEKDDTTDHLAAEGEELMSSSIHSIEPPKHTAPVAEVDRDVAEETEDTEEIEEQGKGEEGGEEEEMDPEIRRRMELRERMAKMSGGMGMGAMFGAPAGLPGMGARKPPKSRATDSSVASDEQIESSSPPSQPIPVMPGMAMPGMALPGMGVPRPKKVEPLHEEPEVSREDEDEDEDGDEDHPISKSRAPEVVPNIEDVKKQTEDGEDREVQPERSLPPPPQAPSETRPAPPVPLVPAESKRRSMLPPDPALPAAPPVPQRASEQSEPRELPALPALPPPPPTQVSNPPLPPNSPPRQSLDQSGYSRLPPPIPGSVETAAYGRAPPPPPPAAPPRPSMDGTRPAEPEEEHADEEEEEEDEEDEEDEQEREDSDYEEADAVSHDDELHHAGLPSLGPSTRAPPPPPPGQLPAQAPRSGPPPLPTQPPRQSRELPRGPPPIPPPAMSPTGQEDEYDPFNYQSNPQGVSTGSASSTPHVEIQQPDLYGASPPTNPSIRMPMSPPIPQGPPRQTAPPVPPVELPSQQPPTPPPSVTASSQAPPPFTAPQAPPRQAPPPITAPPPPTIQQPQRQSLDLLSKAQSRRSVDVPRPSAEQHDYIAQDVDLGRESNWWSHRRSPPPVFQNRGDVSIEYDESTTVQNDGHALTAKHVYVLFMDYSQTIITAYYSQDNPIAGAEFQQRHEPPPARLREDQLEAAHTRFGAKLAAAAKGKENHAVADGSALGFVQELMRTVVPEALGPVGTRAFGAVVYANMANASVTQSDHIRAGDVISLRNAKLQGHRGGLKQKYALDLASHVGFVLDWDGTKQKVRIYEQNGRKVKVESYRLGDLKTGEVKIWRVVSREWVGWGSTG